MLVGKSALLINEMQIGVVHAAHTGFPALAEQVTARGIIPKIAALADAFRKAGAPVFHGPVRGRPDRADVKPNSLITALSLKGQPMAEGDHRSSYVPELQPQDGDFEIVRTSGLITMCGTQMDAVMRRMGIETLVLTGVSTNVGIPGNAITAEELGYYVVVAEDCIAGTDPDTHRTIVDNQLRMIARIMPSEEIAAALDG